MWFESVPCFGGFRLLSSFKLSLTKTSKRRLTFGATDDEHK